MRLKKFNAKSWMPTAMNATKYISAIAGKLRQTRLKLCSKSLWAFAKNYLSDKFQLPPSIMHKEVSKLLVDGSNNRNERIAIAEPHEYQLSNLTCLAYILWSICYQKETFITIISVKHNQSTEMLNSIKFELTSNNKLRKDFPKAVGKNKILWRRNECITSNNIKLVAAGINQRRYFFRFNGRKPSLIIFDNIDDGLRFLTDYYRDIMQEKFREIILGNTDNSSNILATGNISDCESILSRIIIRQEIKNWTTRKYMALIKDAENQRLWDRWRKIYNWDSNYYHKTGSEAAEHFYNDNREAMLKGSEVLWPEHEDYKAIMRWRCEMEDEVFNCLMPNSPSDAKLKKRARMREEIRALEASLAEEDA